MERGPVRRIHRAGVIAGAAVALFAIVGGMLGGSDLSPLSREHSTRVPVGGGVEPAPDRVRGAPGGSRGPAAVARSVWADRVRAELGPTLGRFGIERGSRRETALLEGLSRLRASEARGRLAGAVDRRRWRRHAETVRAVDETFRRETGLGAGAFLALANEGVSDLGSERAETAPARNPGRDEPRS